MTEDDYARISTPFRDHPQRVTALRACNTGIVAVCYLLYPVLLIVAVVQGDPYLLRYILVPAISFALLTLWRSGVNAPRPYEALDIEPLIIKDTQGKSFPSRHAFSIFVIAASWLHFFWPVGVVLCVLGTALGCIRVIGGVHYPRDVLVGAAVGLVCGLIGYVIIP